MLGALHRTSSLREGFVSPCGLYSTAHSLNSCVPEGDYLQGPANAQQLMSGWPLPLIPSVHRAAGLYSAPRFLWFVPDSEGAV